MFLFKVRNFIKVGMTVTLVSGQYTWASTPQSPIDTSTKPEMPQQTPSLPVLEMRALAPHLNSADQTILVGHLQNSMSKIGETQALSDQEMQRRLEHGVDMYQSRGKRTEAEQLRIASKDIPLIRTVLAQMQKDKSNLIEAIKSDFRNPVFLQQNGLGESAAVSRKQCRKIAAEDEFGPIPLKPDGTPYRRPPLNEFKIWWEKKFFSEEKSNVEVSNDTNCLGIYAAMTAAVLAAGFLVFVWGPIVAIPVAILSIPLTIYAFYLYFKGEIPWDWDTELKRQGLWKEPSEKGCPAP